MPDEVKLLPCPLCRGEARVSHHPTFAATLEGQVSCRNCGLLIRKETQAEAIAAWNTRAIEATRPTDEVVERVAWSWLAEHKNAQVYWYGHIWGDDDREPEEWRVDVESGSINDREWTTVGRGDTPLAAILAAMKDAASD